MITILKKDLIAILVLAFAWEILARIFISNVFPPLSSCLPRLDDALLKLYGVHIAYSLARLGVGLGSGALAGFILGTFIGRTPKLNAFFSPVLFLTYSFPKAVLLPILVICLGIGEASKVSLLAIVSFFQLALACKDGAAQVPPSYIKAFCTLSNSQPSLYRHVIIPAILPKVFSALRLSLGSSLAILFFCENYGSAYGLGNFIWDAFSLFDLHLVYLSCLVFCLVGWILFRLIDLLEFLTVPTTAL